MWGHIQVPLHALDEHLHDLITGIGHWRQAVERGAFLGGLDGPIDQIDREHTSTYQVYTKVSTAHTSIYL